MSGIKFSGFLATPSDGDLGASPLSGKGPNDRAILSEESPNTSPDGSSEGTSLPNSNWWRIASLGERP